jgi:uncharacterized protein (DUF1499 family)
MKIPYLFFVSVFVLACLAALWVRFSPNEPQRWHVDPFGAIGPPKASYSTVVTFDADPAQVFADFDALARSLPRTRVLSGDVASRHITYVTRSRLWRFPDFTSVAVRTDGDGGDGSDTTQLAIFARSRFGQGDGGVNRLRVLTLLKQLQLVDN